MDQIGGKQHLQQSMPIRKTALDRSSGQGDLAKIIIISLTILTRNEVGLSNGWRNNNDMAWGGNWAWKWEMTSFLLEGTRYGPFLC
jgi:hypothetical protein